MIECLLRTLERIKPSIDKYESLSPPQKNQFDQMLDEPFPYTLNYCIKLIHSLAIEPHTESEQQKLLLHIETLATELQTNLELYLSTLHNIETVELLYQYDLENLPFETLRLLTTLHACKNDLDKFTQKFSKLSKAEANTLLLESTATKVILLLRASHEKKDTSSANAGIFCQRRHRGCHVHFGKNSIMQFKRLEQRDLESHALKFNRKYLA